MSLLAERMKAIAAVKSNRHYLSLDPHTFDQTNKGWRTGKTHDKKIKMLHNYIKEHVNGNNFKPTTPKGKKKLGPDTLHWHLGQLHAFKGDNKKAIHYMKKSLSKDDHQWNDYAHGTIAFLQKNKKKFAKHFGKPNYNANTLERLHKNFDKPYKDAY